MSRSRPRARGAHCLCNHSDILCIREYKVISQVSHQIYAMTATGDAIRLMSVLYSAVLLFGTKETIDFPKSSLRCGILRCYGLSTSNGDFQMKF